MLGNVVSGPTLDHVSSQMILTRELCLVVGVLALTHERSLASLDAGISNRRRSCGWVVTSSSSRLRLDHRRERHWRLWGRQVSARPVTSSDRERTVVIAYHKPANVITSHSISDARPSKSPSARRTVYQDIESMKGYVGPDYDSTINTTFSQVTGIRSKYHAIGRLDVDTTGLLLLTNDGGLVHHVTNPTASTHDSNFSNTKITKTYQALVMGHWEDDQLEPLRVDGVDIGAKHGGVTQPVHHAAILSHPTAKSTMVELTISEGRNRQVRRMFHALKSGVMNLKRIRIGESLNLNGISEPGEWYMLSDEEVKEGLNWEPRILDKNVYSSRRELSPTLRNRRSRSKSKTRRRTVNTTTAMSKGRAPT